MDAVGLTLLGVVLLLMAMLPLVFTLGYHWGIRHKSIIQYKRITVLEEEVHKLKARIGDK